MTASRRGRIPWRRLVPAATAALLVLVLAGGLRAAWVIAGAAVAAVAESPAPAGVHNLGGADDASPDVGLVEVRGVVQQAGQGCERCHGELELLRQQAGGLARAEELLVPEHTVAGSAHGEMSCSECHAGFARYPHPAAGTETSTCASCHASADSLWQTSSHAAADEPVRCAQCHTVHEVAPADSLRPGAHAVALNRPCASCHTTNTLPVHSPHADTVACASCHAPHDTRPVGDPDSWLSAGRQVATCASCHDSVASIWSRDIHGDAELRNRHLAGAEPASESVLCTSCHLGHEMLPVASDTFAVASVRRCAECHEKAARTFYGSYHGRATELGSSVSASCADCHGAHDVLPDSMPASHVSEGMLVETCGSCHEHARPAFVQYDAHPDPFNRARNPWIFFAFFMMNGLLVFVLLVFGGHTLLWWLRLWLDKRKGIIHGPGHSHGTHEPHAASASADVPGGAQ